MSRSALKTIQAAAGGASDPVYVDDVFSTYVYTGVYSNTDIVNGIDLAGEGGLVWTKRRNSTRAHDLSDTERGVTKSLYSVNNDAQGTDSQGLLAFNSNGYRIGGSSSYNNTNDDYVSWTFRKAPGFFDVVTYTGNGSSQNISHNLGTTPGFIVIKSTSHGSTNWSCWHRSIPTAYVLLNHTQAAQSGVSRTVNDSTFQVMNWFDEGANGRTYVAYLFAHDAQDFGENSDEAIIKCDTYTGNGSTTGPIIDLGFEPQWLLIKKSSGDAGWYMYDNMRGVATGGNDALIYANYSNQEATNQNIVDFTSTGFQIVNADGDINANGATHIYMAIRRPHKPASEFAATNLFAVNSRGAVSPPPSFYSGFVVDAQLRASDINSSSDGTLLFDRLRGETNALHTHSTQAESAAGSTVTEQDQMEGIGSNTGVDTNDLSWMWRRAPGYFDVVCYNGTGSARTVAHNLAVAPEMIWLKNRSSSANWELYLNAGGTEYGYYGLDQKYVGLSTSLSTWNNTSPTNSVVSVSSQSSNSSYSYVMYLFASAPGISKIGTYSGTGSELTVDCGFSAGARYVLIKRADSSMGSGGESYFVFDTVRGITASSSPYIPLNDTDAQASGSFIKPDSSGFKVTSQSVVNTSGKTYVFYAIA